MREPLDINEAAAHFRMSRRAFQDFLKRHPHYVLAGSKKLFYPEDIEALKEAGRRVWAEMEEG